MICRKCSECEGEHHFSDTMRADNGDYACKHCEATCPTCEDCGEAVGFVRHMAGAVRCVDCEKAESSRYWPHEKRPRKPWLAVIVEEDYDFRYDHFDTEAEAVAFVKEDGRKACVVGPSSVEDHT